MKRKIAMKSKLKTLSLSILPLIFIGCSPAQPNPTLPPQHIPNANIEYKNQKEKFYQELNQMVQEEEKLKISNSKEKEDELFIYKQLMQQNL